MQPCAFRIALPHLFGGRFRYLGIDGQKLPPCAHRLQLHFCRPLEIIKIVPGFSDVRRADHNVMISHKENIVGAQDTRQTVPFSFIKGQAVIVCINRGATVKLIALTKKLEPAVRELAEFLEANLTLLHSHEIGKQPHGQNKHEERYG